MGKLPEFIALEMERELARRKHLNFVDYTWDQTDVGFLIGIHTIEICRQIDIAMERFRQGKSSFIICTMPYRHGKSTLISRTFPPHFLAEFPEKEIALVTHNTELAHEMSQDARNLITSNKKFKELYPEIKLAQDAKNKKTWRLSNGVGKAQYFGFGTGISGRGATCLIIDDYYGNPEDAFSETIRATVYKAFAEGMMTRIPDPSIVFMLATRWHPEDLIGAYEELAASNPDIKKPVIISFPGESKDYPTGYLFPEKFSSAWYKNQKATLGGENSVGFQAQMQCNPIPDGGNMFNIDGINIIEEKDVPEHRQIITVDLASSEVDLTKKKRNKSGKYDPDYTVCMRGFMTYDQNNIPKIFITNMLRIRESAVKRDQKIKDYLVQFHDQVYTENFGAYKDTYHLLKDSLTGLVSILPLTLSGDKEVKASPLIPLFDAGNVYIVKNSYWNQDFINEARLFPSGKHDDMIDCMAMIYHKMKRQPKLYARKKAF